MVLKIEGLSKTFPAGKAGTIDALEGIDLLVGDHELISILGPSGCGKTTLLRIVAGLEKPTSGSVILDGEEVTRPNPRMAMIFQEYSLLPWRTVIDNVAFGLELRGIPKEDRYRVAREYLGFVGLTGFDERSAYELSGGMRQRVAVARALAIDPSVLLMDEPFGALDAQTRNMLQRELLDIWMKTQKTILFVTHSVDEAVFLSDRMVVLTQRPGRVKEIIGVPLPRPRDRTSGEFAAIRRNALSLIEEQAQIR